mmetsp:Transcript_20873/g.64217  ORF Transcript_20873/g.64217 Transcript_20873/m.64217 type:complete len:373 (+) Transcript_20873:360-1478(+)
MAQPPAPTLRLEDGKSLVLEFDALPKMSHAAVHFFAAGTKWFLDGESFKLVLQPGEAIPLKGRAKHRPQTLAITNLDPDVSYTATVCFRGPNSFSWGPESPRSAPLTLERAARPGAPMLEPVSNSQILVRFALPPDSDWAAFKFEENAAGSTRAVKADLTLWPASKTSSPLLSKESLKTGTIVVKGLDSSVSYRACLLSHNGITYSADSPFSKSLRLSDYAPAAPCQPLIDRISEDSVRVKFSLFSDCTHATIRFSKVGTAGDFIYDPKTGKITTNKVDSRPQRARGKDGLIIGGFSSDTTYLAYCKQINKFGWSPKSEALRFKTLPATVEYTGTTTQEQRDAPKRKNAVDLTGDAPAVTPSPTTKKPKNGQ